VALFVVDASVVCSWVLPDEEQALSEVSLNRLQQFGATAPDLLWYEVRNVLAVSCRRKRISVEQAKEALAKLRRSDILTIPVNGDAAVLDLGSRYSLSAYDAAYLTLALERKLALATLDQRLAAAALQAGCPLLA
jgi:Predicted nucleic acid-binding protein, contains PIN domain